MTPSLRRLLMVVCLLAPGTTTLQGQGYDTKFKSVGYTPGDVYQTDDGVNVSLSGGGVEVSLPLGPGLPGPLPLRPTLVYHGKFSQSLNPHWDSMGYYNDTGINNPTDPNEPLKWKRWSPPSFPAFSLSPGTLILRVAQNGWYGEDSPQGYLSITSPTGGVVSYFDGAPGAHWYGPADAAEVQSIAKAAGPAWLHAADWGTVGTGTTGLRTSDGSILIFGPYDHQILGFWDTNTNLDGTPRDQYINVPSEILQVQGNTAILWRQSRNYYRGDRNDQLVASQMRWAGSLYHPVWIRTRSGFVVQMDVQRNAPLDFPTAPRNSAIPMVERGLLKSWTVSYQANGQTVGYTVDASSSTLVSFQGMAGTPATTGITLTGASPAQVRSTTNWMPGTTEGYDNLGMQRFYDAEYVSGELAASPFGGSGGTVTLVHGPFSTQMEFNGPAQGLLSKLVEPNGKTFTFNYQVVTGVGVSPGSNGTLGGWSYNSSTPAALDYWSLATAMSTQDGVASQTRTTSYQWAIPSCTVSGGTLIWPSRNQGVAQTLPDGQVVLHVFASPVDLPYGGSGTPALQDQASTFMAMRQKEVARYTYAVGDASWQSFFSGGDPASTTWYKRERFEGWDFRAWEGALTKVMANAEPRATRSISEVRGGPVMVTEQDAWSPANNQYAVGRTYALAVSAYPVTATVAPGALQGVGSSTTYMANPGVSEAVVSGTLSQGVKANTFATPTEGLFARVAESHSAQLKAPTSGQPGVLPTEIMTYDATPGRAHVALAKSIQAADGSGAHLDLAYTSTPQGMYSVDRLTDVTLSGSAPNQATTGSLSGQMGAHYTYDATGRWMTQIQLRKDGTSYYPFTVQEPTHDDMGRPLSQVDENLISTTFAWDDLGRITGITPSAPETGSVITPDNSLRRVTVDRGSQRMIYHLNGFGELIAEERVSSAGSSHRLHGFDSAGRKTWTTLWRSGSPDLTKWTGALPGDGATFTYDARGRLTRSTDSHGQVLETRYDIGGNPLVTQQVAAPGTAQESIATTTRDVLGRLAEVVTSPDGGTTTLDTTYAYDAAGRILKVVQLDGHTGLSQARTWAYDGLGRLTTLVQPESGTTTYGSFTVTGQPTVTTYGAGTSTARSVTTSFDPLGRVTSVQASDGSVQETLAYDEAGHGAANGRLTTANNGGVSRSLTYSGLNGRLSQMVRTALSQSFTLGLSYDTYGNLASRTYPDGKVQTLSYDLSRNLPNGSGFNGANLATMAYDTTSWLLTGLTFANNGSSVFGYDRERLASMAHFLPGQTLSSWAFQYDNAGNLTTDGEDWYSYDRLGRLTGAFLWDPQDAQAGHGLQQTFAYDGFGNRTSGVTQRVTNWSAGTQPPSAPSYGSLAGDMRDLPSYTMTGGEIATMAAKNQLPTTVGGLGTGAAYDDQGNLTSLWRKPGSSSAQTQLTMTYDALGRVATLADAARPGVVEKYLYDDEGLRMVVETWQNSELQKRTFNVYNEARQLVAQYEWVLQ